ncbi:large-conductance mechanosensitive channel protein MscL [Prevotella sp. E13-17]|uniref:large-conductance mechanosensitive channel protein MscL n=1 Tax=Prevotella sp. E13-17 TaxID=2913616 RepID=UPI001EDBF91F|nr:large-conductance mechanosensitive channel protein MscL [Prevotella sp. E13-17]UKK50462.1 large-conductance mechanosensitive channel protein MscL [Prevotella sp. E13-17]
MGFIKEFKEFAMRGNVLDMAVGVIIGGAFGKIVSSLVNDILMPPIGWLIGGIEFTDLKVELPVNPLMQNQDAVTINYGQFIQTTLDFIIVAFCIFLLIKGINKLANLRKKEEAAAAPEPPKGPTQEELLTEIRDLLKQK